MTDGVIGRRVRIHGRVQGVWYRGWTVRKAKDLGLRGWVRNRSDGSVEAVFAGPAVSVDAMIEACHVGPPAARVDKVTAELVGDDDYAALAPLFEQRATE